MFADEMVPGCSFNSFYTGSIIAGILIIFIVPSKDVTDKNSQSIDKFTSDGNYPYDYPSLFSKLSGFSNSGHTLAEYK
jgi:hypothetical protein